MAPLYSIMAPVPLPGEKVEPAVAMERVPPIFKVPPLPMSRAPFLVPWPKVTLPRQLTKAVDWKVNVPSPPPPPPTPSCRLAQVPFATSTVRVAFLISISSEPVGAGEIALQLTLVVMLIRAPWTGWAATNASPRASDLSLK